MEKFKGTYLFKVFAENLIHVNSLEENECLPEFPKCIFPNCIKIMDTTIFIDWFIFHSISGSAKNLKKLCLSGGPLNRYKIYHANFFPEGTSLPLPHGILLPTDCAAAASFLCFMNGARTVYPWLWKRYTCTNIYEWCDSDCERLTSPPIF